MKTFGQTLRERRKSEGWTLEDVAKHLDCTKQYLSEVENDKLNPSIKLAKKLSRVYGAKFIASIFSRSPGYLSKKVAAASPLHLACIKLILEAPNYKVRSVCKSILRDKAMDRMESKSRKSGKTKNQ